MAQDNAIESQRSVTADEVKEVSASNANLGHVRLRHVDTHEIILIPTPSSDPKDPLNWPKWFKTYTAVVVCLAMIMCNYLAAGPTLAIVETAQDFFPDWQKTGLNHPISQTAYFFNCTALFQGLGNLIWMPIINKYGRRPAYVCAFTLYTVTAVWCAVAKQYANFLVARIMLGFAGGAGECLAPMTIADMFFLHERGTWTAAYTASLNLGVALGAIIDGFIVRDHPWRYIYYVAIALIGFVTILVFFTFPETAYIRNASPLVNSEADDLDESRSSKPAAEHSESHQAVRPDPKLSEFFFSGLKLYSGTYTDESFWKMTIRPVMLLALPNVLWATLVMSVTIGFIVAVTSNVAPAYALAYGFVAWQSGLAFFAAIIGAFIGMAFGGKFSDWVADFFTRRNGGIREPEFRLPAIMLSVICGPLALVLYGVGIEHKLHWIVPTIGIGLINFAITQATNVSLVYTIDCYRPIAGEIVVTQLAFKSAFGFLLGFYTNPWVQSAGYQTAYGIMGAICGGVLIMWIPLFFWGHKIRVATLNWGIMKYARWESDREVGE
ncbi:hypothetical protein NLU13_7312 [Sarocladium strictum]|uniref:Major facilitator superfamily (MFS) profile domain-containing protein n=1 Tax=Sarocladium strictum TaxID=5046 RepID=A0AA39GE26_SARSR|nr:hypothetical protein NLU13_7312 [Sarocladium strictum]